MRSNFDTPMELKDGVVEACGPLDWTGETEAFVTVTVRQPGEQVVGTASRATIEPGEDEWMVEVTAAGDREFTPGPAVAMGVLSAVEEHGVSVFHWTQEVQIENE
jgi:hypothetical protein